MTSFLGTAGVIFSSFHLEKARLLQFLGKNSLIILVLHYPVIRMLKAVVYYFTYKVIYTPEFWNDKKITFNLK